MQSACFPQTTFEVLKILQSGAILWQQYLEQSVVSQCVKMPCVAWALALRKFLFRFDPIGFRKPRAWWFSDANFDLKVVRDVHCFKNLCSESPVISGFFWRVLLGKIVYTRRLEYMGCLKLTECTLHRPVWSKVISLSSGLGPDLSTLVLVLLHWVPGTPSDLFIHCNMYASS